MNRGPFARLPTVLAAVMVIATQTSGAAVLASGATERASATTSSIDVEPSYAELIGQKLVVRMSGTTPSTALLGRIRRGEVGGVILFGFNITTTSALTALTQQLQAAATTGNQPPLLIMVDQEGGTVRRVPWAPPTMSAYAMGLDGRSSVARDQGSQTGAALRSLGFNVNLAPVADVPSSSRSFMYQARRTFAWGPRKTGRLANAFAEGLRAEGVVATHKHFPGIGRAKLNTDRYVVTIRASRATLRDTDLVPFRKAIAAGARLIMLSNANYSAYDPKNGAGWSPAVQSLLRDALGFTGVTITDSLNGTAVARGISVRKLAVRAARAGTDLILLTGTESATQRAYETLVAKAEAGSIPLATLEASYTRILELKSGL